MKRAGCGLAAIVLISLLGCGDSTGAGSDIDVVGTWDLIGFSEAGVEAIATGTMEFRDDGTVSVVGTVTFPGEPTDQIDVEGTYEVDGKRLILTVGAEPSAPWKLRLTEDILLLTEDTEPLLNTITLRRQ